MNYGLIHRALWLLLVAYWIISAFGNKKTVQRYKPGQRLLAFVALVVVYWALFYYKNDSLTQPIHDWLMQRTIPDTDLIGPLSTALCAAGIAFAIWARHTLGRNWNANPGVKEGHELIVNGPYRFVRHPIYTGMLLALFGSLVVGDGRIRGLLFFAFIAIGLHFKSKIEEGLMMQTFPNSYPEYRRRTKAIIPFIL